MDLKNRQRLKICLNICGYLDLFGVSILYPLIAGRAKSFGATPSTVGMIGSIYGSIQLFSSPIMGRIADKYDRKRVLVFCLLATAVGYVMLGMADTIFLLMLARIPSGIFKQTQGLAKVYLTDATEPHERTAAFGSFNSCASLGFIIGPIIGGNLAMLDNGFMLVSIVSATIFILNGLFVNFAFASQNEIAELLHVSPKEKASINDVGKIDPSQVVAEEKINSNWLNDMKSIDWHSLFDVFIIRFLLSFSMILFRSSFTVILEYRYNSTPRFNGYLLSLNGVVAAISGILVGKIGQYFSSLKQLHCAFSMLMVISLISMTFAPTIWIIVFSLIPLCIATSVLRVTNSTSLYKKCSSKERGFLTGLGDSLTSVARMLAPILGGFAQDYSDYGSGTISCALAGVATIIALLSDFGTGNHKSTKENKVD